MSGFKSWRGKPKESLSKGKALSEQIYGGGGESNKRGTIHIAVYKSKC